MYPGNVQAPLYFWARLSVPATITARGYLTSHVESERTDYVLGGGLTLHCGTRKLQGILQREKMN
ncbi:hypothetical protein GCM10010464_40800 [Pseudonocardia yunnanensis]